VTLGTSRTPGGDRTPGTAPGTAPDLVRGEDGALRCWWAAATPELERYHDLEWGRGGRDESALFERLSLEAFQSGLSWRIVLERRDALRESFASFDPERVARFTDRDVDRLMMDERIIRNRAKITAVIHNSGLIGRLHAEGIHLRDLTEAAIARSTSGIAAGDGSGGTPRRREDVPATSPASEQLARDLRRLGWRFIGPTTAHAYLQAAGWVDDHLLGCHARGRDDGPHR
jgi:DNA-3-methyladenine glycosylase I